MGIENMSPRTGRMLREDGKVVNEADGINLDLRGLAANKPAANTVEPGTTFWSVDTDPHGDSIEVSNGTSWVVV